MFGRNGESPMPVIAASSPERLLRRRPSRRCASPSQLHDRRWSSSPTATSPTAPSRGSCPKARSCRDLRVEFRTDPEGLPALQARPGDAGPRRGRSPARPASSTASAASRRRTSPATSPTTPRTTSTWSTCAPRRCERIAARHPATLEVVRRRRGRPAGPRLGLDLRRHHRPRSAWRARKASRSATPTCAT